ncbi:MAG: PAS domain-containing protein [Desulfuromonadales bacterium]|nr:PAS domain-containing protein [Desulfuromonadales bacterium]
MKLRRLVWQIYPSFLLVILLVLIGLGWYVSITLRTFHYERTAVDLRSRAQLVSEQLNGLFDVTRRPMLTALIKRLGENSGTRITVVRKDGLVLADSLEDPVQMDDHGGRPEIINALAGREGMSIRFSHTLGQTLMYVALPFDDEGTVLGTVRTAVSVSSIDDALRSIYQRLLIGGSIIALLAAPISWFLSRKICHPLERMTVAAQGFSQGKLDTPLPETGTEEAQRLAKALNIMAHELSERIHREVDQRCEMEAILGCMVEGIIAVDNDERVIRLNRAAAKLFHVENRGETGRPIQELIRHAGLQRFVGRALSSHQPLEEELSLLGVEKRYLHVQAAPLTAELNERIGVLIVLHDLTRMKQLESVRRDFVANVSHELKTPITAIRGAVETLLDEHKKESAELQFLQIIFKQSERLNALVEDLLDLSRIEQGVNEGGWELKPAPLLPVLKSAGNACESLLEQRQVSLEVDCPAGLQLRMNPQLMEQAVINLLSNAVKYSDPGNRVIIKASELEDRILLQVQDFGCGIEEKHQARLFERFYRVDLARSRSLGGTGLGLAIVKHIALAHQGEVQVRSTPGQGSVFSMVFAKLKRVG